MVQGTDFLAGLLCGDVARPHGSGELIRQELVAAEVGDDVVRQIQLWAAHRSELHGRKTVHGAAGCLAQRPRE